MDKDFKDFLTWLAENYDFETNDDLIRSVSETDYEYVYNITLIQLSLYHLWQQGKLDSQVSETYLSDLMNRLPFVLQM